MTEVHKGKYRYYYRYPAKGMGEVFHRHRIAFQEIFDLPLSPYFHIYAGGFDMQAFTTQVLEYNGENPGARCMSMFGAKGKNLVAQIMMECADEFKRGNYVSR